MDLIQNQCDDSASEKSIKWYIEEETVCDYQKEPQKYIEEIMDDSEKELSNSVSGKLICILLNYLFICL